MKSSKLYIDVFNTKRSCYEYVKNYAKYNNKKEYIEYFLNYYIGSLIYYLNCLAVTDFKLYKNFYDQIMKVFEDIKIEYGNEYLIRLPNYRKFTKILKSNLLTYNFSQIIQRIFYLGNFSKTHKILRIFGFSFKFKRGKL